MSVGVSRFFGWTWALVCALAFAAPAGAATRLHALIIGNNAVFPSVDGEPSDALIPLKYADDDAAAVSALVKDVAASLHLLTVMDATTQALYPLLAAAARPPTLAEVDAAVRAIAAAIDKDRAHGDQSVVWFFFSGHGSTSYRGEPGLALLDGALSRRHLYEGVLSRLPAKHIHVLVDACHAESVVRARDSNAETVGVAPEIASAILARSTLEGFPNTGALLVSSREAQAHEWDAIGHGVFTHQLLSALRGAADVNGDRVIEYSEVQAFVSAANRSVKDARARAALVVHAPALDRRAPLFDLSAFPRDRAAWLTGVSSSRGVVQVLDEHGQHLLTLHNAKELSSSLVIPAGTVLYVIEQGYEAELVARPGQLIRFAELSFRPASSRSRGSLANALARGLFRTPFGRAYYEGFTDNAPDLVPVPFAPAHDGASPAPATPSPAGSEPTFRLAAGVGFSDSVAQMLGMSRGLRLAVSRADGHGPSVALDGVTASKGPLTEWRMVGTLGWLWQTRPRLMQVYAGLHAGAGVIFQTVEGASTHSSALGVGAASTGITTRIVGRFGLFAEVDLAGHLLRRDAATRFEFVPSGWLGGSWGMM